MALGGTVALRPFRSAAVILCEKLFTRQDLPERDIWPAALV
jgi:hypothetical protein